MIKSVIFDLDDTLYKELDYVKSGFLNIADMVSKITKIDKKNIYDKLYKSFISNKNPFKGLINDYKISLSLNDLIQIYRSHNPSIRLREGAYELLNVLIANNISIGLITDGRSSQQRKKIHSLGIEKFFQSIIISEEFGSAKPHSDNFLFFMNSIYPKSKKFYYIGDNTSKDFLTPNKLDWITICLEDDGDNIHKQDFQLDKIYLPQHRIDNLSKVVDIVL